MKTSPPQPQLQLSHLRSEPPPCSSRPCGRMDTLEASGPLHVSAPCLPPTPLISPGLTPPFLRVSGHPRPAHWLPPLPSRACAQEDGAMCLWQEQALQEAWILGVSWLYFHAPGQSWRVANTH